MPTSEKRKCLFGRIVLLSMKERKTKTCFCWFFVFFSFVDERQKAQTPWSGSSSQGFSGTSSSTPSQAGKWGDSLSTTNYTFRENPTLLRGRRETWSLRQRAAWEQQDRTKTSKRDLNQKKKKSGLKKKRERRKKTPFFPCSFFFSGVSGVFFGFFSCKKFFRKVCETLKHENVK